MTRAVTVAQQGSFTAYVTYNFVNSNTQTTVDSFSTAAYRSAEYIIQTTDTTSPANSYQMTKLLVVHDGTTPYLTEYGTITTNAAMGSFNAAISAGSLNLRYTPVSNNVTVKLYRSAVAV